MQFEWYFYKLFAVFQTQIKRVKSSDETKNIRIFFAEINILWQFNQVWVYF